MGFGLMFIGYIIAFAGSVVPQISALTFILGSGIILLSLKKLIYENKLFIVALVFAFLLEVSSIISLGIELFFVPNTVSVVFGYIANASSFLLNLFLMLAIFVLAKDVEVNNVKILSLVSSSLVGASSISYILCQAIRLDYVLERLYVVHFIMSIAYIVLSAITIFNAYARICYEGDENMQRETSGIPIFDALNKLFDKAFTRKNDKGKK